MASRGEIFDFIARSETFDKTLERFPGLTREALRGLLREAAILLRSAETDETAASGADAPAPPPRSETAPPPTAPSRTIPTSTREPSRRLRLYSDGASRGNPGPSGAGAVVVKVDGTVVRKLGKYLGERTNNQAEYMALLLGLEAVERLGANEVEVYADSELLIRQLEGRYQVKNAGIRPLYAEARLRLARFRRTFLQHIPREDNAAADEMSNRAIDERLNDV